MMENLKLALDCIEWIEEKSYLFKETFLTKLKADKILLVTQLEKELPIHSEAVLSAVLEYTELIEKYARDFQIANGQTTFRDESKHTSGDCQKVCVA
jgi:hypothetical protein